MFLQLKISTYNIKFHLRFNVCKMILDGSSMFDEQILLKHSSLRLNISKKLLLQNVHVRIEMTILHAIFNLFFIKVTFREYGQQKCR